MKKFIIQIFKCGRWRATSWTRRGNPVQYRAAVKAEARAHSKFPWAKYRIQEVKAR